MINAIVRYKDKTAVIKLPRTYLDIYEELLFIGYRKPLERILLTDNEGDNLRVKIYSDNDFGRHLCRLFVDGNADLSPVIGSEQDGVRPVVILQNNTGNRYSSTTIVAAITGELDKAKLPTHIIFAADGMKKKSMVLLEQIRTIDKARIGKFVCALNPKTMKKIDEAILISFGLDYSEGI